MDVIGNKRVVNKPSADSYQEPRPNLVDLIDAKINTQDPKFTEKKVTKILTENYLLSLNELRSGSMVSSSMIIRIHEALEIDLPELTQLWQKEETRKRKTNPSSEEPSAKIQKTEIQLASTSSASLNNNIPRVLNNQVIVINGDSLTPQIQLEWLKQELKQSIIDTPSQKIISLVTLPEYIKVNIRQLIQLLQQDTKQLIEQKILCTNSHINNTFMKIIKSLLIQITHLDSSLHSIIEYHLEQISKLNREHFSQLQTYQCETVTPYANKLYFVFYLNMLHKYHDDYRRKYNARYISNHANIPKYLAKFITDKFKKFTPNLLAVLKIYQDLINKEALNQNNVQLLNFDKKGETLFIKEVNKILSIVTEMQLLDMIQDRYLDSDVRQLAVIAKPTEAKLRKLYINDK